MGFRQGAYARMWSVDNMGKYSLANISVSRKDKDTNKYSVEFSDGYVRLVKDAHEYAQELDLPSREEFDSQIDRGVTIRILACDVTNKYDAEKKKIYTNCTIFDFEIPEDDYGTKKSKNIRRKSKNISDEYDEEDEDNEVEISKNRKTKPQTRSKSKKELETDTIQEDNEDDISSVKTISKSKKSKAKKQVEIDVIQEDDDDELPF